MRRIRQRIGLAGLVCTSLLAQDIDSVIYAGGAGRTILDQIENPSERDAFRRLLAEKAAKQRLAKARQFLEANPQSWLLAQVYEIASKAAIDLSDLKLALFYGEESLRLLPENPSLLVPLANVEAHLGRMDSAASHATEAIGYLQRFGRPAGFSDQDWRRTDRELEASARYVLGRVFATRGFASEAAERWRWMELARGSLDHSRALYRGDPLAAYLLGLVLLDLRLASDAAVELAAALDAPDGVGPRALQELRKLHKSSNQEVPFESYLQTLQTASVKRKHSVAAPAEADRANRGDYAGSESCRSCHAAIHASWSRTGMARMLRPYKPENLIAHSGWTGEFREGTEGDAVQISRDGDRSYFSFQGEKGGWIRFPVDYTIGSKWQQAYATRLPNGRIHVFPIQYSAIEKRWVNFWKIIDSGSSERSTIEAFPKLTSATSYQLHCAACHTSQAQSETKRAEPSEINFHEPGVNCETCHGPSADHVDAMKNDSDPRRGTSHPIRFDALDPWRSVQICAQCHMQSRVVELGGHGEINYSGMADPFYQEIRSRPYTEFSLRAIYKDGRFRETTFITESFLRSACFQRGGATCVSCHNPHPPNAEANPKSLKFLDDPDRMCLQCHASLASDVETHTQHPAESEASRCGSCHMPKIMRSMLFQAGTHRIDDIPSTENTARFGPEESPNACLMCHQKSLEWLREQLANWPTGTVR